MPWRLGVRGGPALLLGLILVPVLGGLCLAGEFRAEMSRLEGGREIKGRLFVSGPKIRQEMTVGGMELVTLVDREQKKFYLVRPQARIYTEKPFGAALTTVLYDQEALAKVGRVERLGPERVEEMDCDKFKVVFDNPQNGEALIWRSRELDLPVRIVRTTALGETEIRYTNVEHGAQEADLFGLPEGYRAIAPRGAQASD